MAGPKVPSRDINPLPSFAATGPTVVPMTFRPAPPILSAPLAVLNAPPATFPATPATLLPAPSTAEPTFDWLTACHAFDRLLPITVFPAPRKFFTPPAMPPRSRPFGPAIPERICPATFPVFATTLPTGLFEPKPTTEFFSPVKDCPTRLAYCPTDEPFRMPKRPPDSVAPITSFTKERFAFELPLCKPLKFFSAAHVPMPAPFTACPTFPSRVVGWAVPVAAI